MYLIVVQKEYRNKLFEANVFKGVGGGNSNHHLVATDKILEEVVWERGKKGARV